MDACMSLVDAVTVVCVLLHRLLHVLYVFIVGMMSQQCSA